MHQLKNTYHALMSLVDSASKFLAWTFRYQYMQGEAEREISPHLQLELCLGHSVRRLTFRRQASAVMFP